MLDRHYAAAGDSIESIVDELENDEDLKKPKPNCCQP